MKDENNVLPGAENTLSKGTETKIEKLFFGNNGREDGAFNIDMDQTTFTTARKYKDTMNKLLSVEDKSTHETYIYVGPKKSKTNNAIFGMCSGNNNDSRGGDFGSVIVGQNTNGLETISAIPFVSEKGFTEYANSGDAGTDTKQISPVSFGFSNESMDALINALSQLEKRTGNYTVSFSIPDDDSDVFTGKAIYIMEEAMKRLPQEITDKIAFASRVSSNYKSNGVFNVLCYPNNSKYKPYNCIEIDEITSINKDVMLEKTSKSLRDDDLVLERSDAFIVEDNVDEFSDEVDSSLAESEKPDEYIENLMEEELAQAEAEAEAELEKEEKRKKDKEKAKENERIAREEANKKYEQDMALENERRAEEERARNDNATVTYNYDNPQYPESSKPYENAPYDYTSQKASDDDIPNYDVHSDNVQYENSMQETSYSIPGFDAVYDNVPSNNSESFDIPKNIHPEQPVSTSYSSDMPINDAFPSVDIKDNKSDNVQGSQERDYSQNPSNSRFPDEYSERKFKEKRDAVYEEQLERQKIEKEKSDAFFERVQQNTYEKQRASENYQSFGNEGIDYSGDNRHSAYVYTDGAFEKEAAISEPVYKSIKEDYEKCKAECRSYGSHVPESVLEKYQQSSDLYFSIERRVHEGTLSVKPETEVPHSTRKTEQGNYTADYNYGRDDNKVYTSGPDSSRIKEELRYNDSSLPSGVSRPQEPQGFHYSENNNSNSNHFVFSSHQEMARRAQEVLYQTRSNDVPEQPKNHTHHVSNERVNDNADTKVSHIPEVRNDSRFESERRSSTLHKPSEFASKDDLGTTNNANKIVRSSSEGANAAFASTVYNISKERYDSLRQKYQASTAEVASYKGKNIPASVLSRNEQINKVYSAIKEKVDSGRVNIVSEGGVGSSPRSGRHTNDGNIIKPSSNRNPNIISGTQVFSESNKHNYTAKNERTGDLHRKPPKTPIHASPLSKYDKLKIYHSRNYLAPVERGTRRAVGALKDAVVYAARSDQTGTVNTMVTGQQRARDTVNTLKVLKNTPRNMAAAYYVTKNAAVTARNAVRFLEGKEALAHKSHKPLTIRQLDKQFKNPFAGAEKNKIDKKFGNKTNLTNSQLNRKIIIKQAQNSALKDEIKKLQAKGSALTADERKKLKALMDKKRVADAELRNSYGLKKARQEAVKRNKQADRASEKSVKKTIKKTKKKGLRLTKKEKAVLARLQDRKDYLKKRDKLLKTKDARKQLGTSLSTIFSKAASESEDSAVQSILNADRVLQNRYVRSILKFSAKAVMLPTIPFRKAAMAGVKALDKKLGVSKAVKNTTKKVLNKTVGSVLNSHVYKELNGGLYNRGKKLVSKHTPQKIKTHVKKANKTISDLNDKRKAVLNKFKALKDRLANSRLGRAASAVSKGVGKVFSAFSFAKKILYKIGLYCASFLIIIVMVGTAITSAGGAVSSLILSDDAVDGKIDVSKYVNMFNKSEQQFLAEIDSIASDPGNKYDNITVNYQSGTMVNNFKEILSMAAVYLEQDFSDELSVEEYMSQLYDDSHYYTTVESEPYSCSGCQVERYSCDGCKSLTIFSEPIIYCPGHERTVCPGNHVDLDINVMVLGFDDIFYADSSINSSINGTGSSTGNVVKGEEIGTFTITYYCTEKYPHICNAGPPYKTATGTDVTPGRTIAVDKTVIPLGTHVVINGHEYIAEDTGGAIKGNRIDIAVATHGEALQAGKKTYKVYAAQDMGGNTDNVTDFYWNEENIEWAKNIYENLNNETYAGLDGLNQFSGGNVSYEGVVFKDGKTEVVYYNQYDIRWKNLPYSQYTTIGKSGCGPTSMAMVVSSLTNTTIDPIQMSNWAASKGYLCVIDGKSQGSYTSLIPGAAANWGIPCVQAGGDVQVIIDALSSGKLVVMNIGPCKYYSGNGHYLLVRGVTEDGRLLVADSASEKKSQVSHPVQDIVSGVKNRGNGYEWWILGF